MTDNPATTGQPPRVVNPITRRPRGNQKGVLGPYSRTIDRGARGRINGNTREGRFLKAYEDELVRHVGTPSATQRLLITRAARIALHLELMDEAILRDGKSITQNDTNQYSAWSNNLARVLSSLKAPVTPVRTHRTLAEIEEDYKR